MKEKDFNYIRCPNCGKYFCNTEEPNKMFCSNECITFYKTCATCGRHFSSSRDENAVYCSETCGTNPEPLVLQEESLQAHLMTPALESLEIELDN